MKLKEFRMVTNMVAIHYQSGEMFISTPRNIYNVFHNTNVEKIDGLLYDKWVDAMCQQFKIV